jgi:hypothetical protein
MAALQLIALIDPVDAVGRCAATSVNWLAHPEFVYQRAGARSIRHNSEATQRGHFKSGFLGSGRRHFRNRGRMVRRADR